MSVSIENASPAVTIGTGFTDRNGRIESCTEQMNCLLDGNLNMWSEIDPKTNHRIKYPGRPAAQVEEAFQFGSNCGIYSVFILVDASNKTVVGGAVIWRKRRSTPRAG